MGGFFGVISNSSCVSDLFYGTDYHSHLGNLRGGMMTWGKDGIRRFIHDITGTPFRTKFEADLEELGPACSGIGAISDTGDQPLIIRSHLGTYGVVMVGAINNQQELLEEACRDTSVHFSEMSSDGVNPNELAASLVVSGKTVKEGIENMLDRIDGSCSMLLLAEDGIYAIRDAFGRTPVVIGRRDGAYAVAMESCALYNLNYSVVRELGPGEAVFITQNGVEEITPPRECKNICSFFWVYFGFPASSYEGRNVEAVRYRCGANVAKAERAAGKLPEVDAVVGVPDSGVAHALGYAQESGVPYIRSFVKYTPTWARSFIPRDQRDRAHVATMKLIPIEDLIRGRRLLFCEDSIVRGTQLGNTFDRLSKCGAKEVHVRSACPPILFNCKYLNFSRGNGLVGLAARRAIARVEGHALTNNRKVEEEWLSRVPLEDYMNPETEKYRKMVDEIRKELHLTSLRYQTLDDLIEAIGLPRECLCTYCWDGKESNCPCHGNCNRGK